jgi:hypothetical protein
MDHESIGSEIAKMSPPVVVSAATFAGYTLQEWVCIATLIYTAFGCCYLALKIRRMLMKNRDGGDAHG